MKYLKYILRVESAIFFIPLLLLFIWPQLISNLFNTSYFPKGHSYLWIPDLIWLHAITDSAIGAAFVAISISLIYLVINAGKYLPFLKIFIAFGLFIILCGITHFISVWTLWYAVYWLSGGVKLFTAAASITTAIALPLIIPKAIQLIKDAKGSVEVKEKLESANAELEKQIAERRKAEEELRKTHDYLEIRVQERTAQLEKMNLNLTAEIAERKKAEEALRESETLFRQLTENIRNVFYVIEPKNKKISYISPAYEEVWGSTRESLYNNFQSWSDSIHPEDKKRIFDAVEEQKLTGKFKEQYRIVRADGEIRWVKVKAFPILDESKNIIRITGVAEDITERKKIDEQIEASLKEKDVLLKEIHHRVKNNLQIISSLLNIQSKYIKDKKTIEIFRESKSRIKSMALIHEKLYGPRDFTRINFFDYISDLSAYLFSAYSLISKEITLNLKIDKIFLSMDTAITLGLVINELISNSLKYAFPAGGKGEISIMLFSEKDGNYNLVVRDNGVGLPPGFDFRNNDSLGLQLVQMFMQQIKGTIELKSEKGTEYKIIFKD